MDSNTVIFPDAYIKEDGSAHNLGIDFNDYIIEIEVGMELIRLNKTQIIGLLAMMIGIERDNEKG